MDIPVEQVVAFVLGDADPQTAAEIQAQLHRSPGLRATVEEVRHIVTLLESDDSKELPPALAKRVGELLRRRAGRPWAGRLNDAVRAVAEHVYDGRRQPALTEFRGSAPALQFTCRSDLGTVELSIDQCRDAPASAATGGVAWSIHGQLCLAGAELPAVFLVHTGTHDESARTRADHYGHFLLPAADGVYDIVIDLEPRLLVLPGISVREE